MKKLNLFSDLWSSVAGSQRNDVEFDRRLTVGSVAVLVLVLTIGIGNAWGGTATITEDFEKQTAGTTYNSTQKYTAANSNAGIAWTIYYGCVSTSSAITTGGSTKSAAMRLYTTANYGYLMSTTNVKGLTKITFKGKAAETKSAKIKIDVQYSTDNGSTWSYMKKTSASGANWSAQTLTTSSTSYDAYIPTAAISATSNYRIKISINSSSTKPSSSNAQLTIDDIVFTYTAYTVTYNGNGNTSGSVPTDATKYTSGSTVTVKSNSGSLAKTGHTFGGWNTQADGNGTNYTAGSGTFTITADKTLYAKWDVESCTAPDHVNISGAWDRFGGEDIDLTAKAYDGSDNEITSGITGYQWQKLVGTTWTNLTNGTAAGVTTSGATSANLRISNCGLDNSGKYRCTISTGATCSTSSATKTDGTEGYGVKVYVLESYNGGTTTYNFTRDGENQRGSVEITLSASTAYTFKVHADADYYGNDGTVNEDVTNWVCSTSKSENLTVNSGLGGKFTFTMDYSTGGNNSTEGIPELSVTYPRKTIYLTPGVWNSDGAKFALYYFRSGGSSGWTDLLTADDCGMSAEIPQWNGVKVDAVRLKSSAISGNWDDKWNQTDDITITSSNSVVITGWNQSDFTYGTYSIPTYTISYNKGTNGIGTRSDDTKTCGTAFTLPNTQVFSRSGYTMDGWATSDGGEKVYNLGGSYTTNAEQTFYPHWAIVNYTITYNLNSGTQQVSPAPATSYNINSSAITLPTPTREGYDFAGWYANSDLSTGGVQTSIAAGSTGNKTYWAKWTIKSYTVDWYVGGTSEEDKLTSGSQTTNVNHGSKVTTLPSTPSGSACDLTFIGWTNTTTYTHGTSTLFTTAAGSPAVTSATKYYAVFAAGSAPATKNLTNSQIQTFHSADATNHGSYAKGPFTITSTDGNWYGVFCSQNNGGVYTANLKSDNVTIDATTYRPFLQSPVYSNDIASVTITHNVTTDRTLLICSSASADPAKDKIASISITSSNQSGVSANIPSGVTQIYLYSSSSGIMLKSIAVSVGGYSGHTLTCEACATSVTPTFTASPEGGTVAVSKSGAPVSSGTAVKTCGGVALTVTITPDSHHKLTNFTATGLTTGTATISPSVATTLATPQASAQTFTVTLSDGAEGTLNLTPTFSENAYRTVVFINNNTKLFDDSGEATTFDATNKWKQKVYVGEKPVLPTALIASQACDDNSTTFMGWVRDNQRWPGKSASSMPAGSTLITAASGFDAAAAGSGEIAYHAVWAERSGDVITVSANLATLKAAVSSISSGYANKEFEMTYSTESYTFNADVTKSTQAATKDWMQVGKMPSNSRYITITDELPGSITNISSTNIYNASGSTYNGKVYYNSTASTTDPIASTNLTSASSFSLDVEDGETAGYIMFENPICLGDLSVTYSTLSYSNYMTTCCASTGLTLEGPTGDLVFITSAAEKKVRSQEAFHISGCGVSGSTTVTFNFGSSALNAKFTCATATGEDLVTTCDGRIDEDFYIYYTPGAGDTSDGIDKSTSLTASVGGTLSANVTLDTKTIIGRHLPADFVIAGKKNGKWYALPATMESTAHPAPVEIAVDDANNPSTAYTIASNKYGLEGPAAGNISDGDGQYVKLTMHPLSDAPLFGQAPSNTGIGKSGTAVATNKLSAGWWWKLEQINTSITNPQDAKYTIYCANNTSSLSIKDNAGNPEWGLYASGVDELRLIPVNAIEFTESEVVAWGQEKLILEVALPVGATQARAKLGDGSWSANKSLATTTGTSVNGTATKYNYTLDFADEIDFSEAASEGKMLVVELLNSGGTALKATSVLIPKIVAANRTIKKATDAAKGPWNTEVHVLPGATLTIDASGYSPADMTIAELNIYPGAAVVAENGTLKATTLVLRNGWDRLSETKKYDVARLFITSSTGSLQTTTAYSDWYIDFDQYYPIAVPWTVTTSAMTYKNTSSAASAGVRMRYYDGASRASNVQNGVGESENWKVYDVGGKAYPATLTPGTGYAMTAKRPTGKAFSIVRMPLTIPSTDWTAGGEQGNVSPTHKDQVSVTAHGNENTPVYAKGWNLIANPYMSLYQGALSYTEGGGAIEYANIPDENFKEFDQQPILTTKLKPSSAFLIKAPATGVVTFATENRKASAPQRYSNEASENEMQIQRAYILLGDDQTEDMMGILVSEKYTADYELNADLEKLLSDGNTLRTYMRYNDMNMAYLAINEELAKQLIPVCVRIPAESEYTFRIHEASIADELEGIYLTDYQTGTTTNLLYDSYTFNAVAGTDNVRFAINAVIGKREVPTGVDISGSDKDRPTKFIWNDKVYILHNNVIYDSTGKRVNVINK